MPVLRIERIAMSEGASQFPTRAFATENQTELHPIDIECDGPLQSGGSKPPAGNAGSAGKERKVAARRRPEASVLYPVSGLRLRPQTRRAFAQ